MRVWAYTVARAETVMLPFFLRHYSSWCERMIIYDGGGHPDGFFDSMGMHPKLTVRPWPLADELDDEAFVSFAATTHKEARGHADYVIWVDTDELLVSLNPLRELELAKQNSIDVLLTCGFQLILDSVPTTTGQLITGDSLVVPDPVYSKPIIFNPGVEMEWCAGKHGCTTSGKVESSGFKLIHCRYLGWDYAVERNARNHARASANNIRASYGYHTKPDHVGQYDRQWYESARLARKPLMAFL